MKKRMKRTQLYLDEDMARLLETMSRQEGTTISELVRESLRERYMQDKKLDKFAIARSLVGIWKDRGDLKYVDLHLRKLRKGSRLKRFGIV